MVDKVERFNRLNKFIKSKGLKTPTAIQCNIYLKSLCSNDGFRIHYDVTSINFIGSREAIIEYFKIFLTKLNLSQPNLLIKSDENFKMILQFEGKNRNFHDCEAKFSN